MNTTQVGVDVAKSVFEAAVSETSGSVRQRHRLARERFRRFFAAREVARRRGFNVAAVALANKLTRVCWRVCTDQRPFEPREAA